MTTNDVENIKRLVPLKQSLRTMRFVSFNINGIKTLFDYYPYTQLKTMLEVFKFLEADFITLQELKISKESVSSFIGKVDNYYNFITIPHTKKGYSGVGVYVRRPVDNVDISEEDRIDESSDVKAVNDFLKVRKVEEGITGLLNCHEYTESEKCYKDLYDLADRYKGTSIDIDKRYNETRDKFLIGGYDLSSVDLTRNELLELDSQGRCIIVEMGFNVVVISCYCPANSTRTDEGESFRVRFLRVLKQRMKNLKDMGKDIVLLGDINVSRDLIDSADNMQQLLGDDKIQKYKNGEELESSNLRMVEDFAKSTAPRAYINSIVYNSHLKKDFVFIDKNNNVLDYNNNGQPLKPKTESLFVDSDDEGEDMAGNNIMSMESISDTLYNKPFLHDLIREHCGKELKLYTCWNSLQNLRPVNFGSRIDLILATENININLKNAGIWRFLNGSDHCPIFCDVELGGNLKSINDYKKFYIPRFEARNLYKLNEKTIMSMFKNLNNNASFLKKNKDESNSEKLKKMKNNEGISVSVASRNKANKEVQTKQVIYVSRKRGNNDSKKQPKISAFFKKVEPKEEIITPELVENYAENSSNDVDELFEKTKTNFLEKDKNAVVQLPVEYKKQPVKKKSILEMVSNKPSKYNDAPKCNHGIECILKTSMTQKTKGKKFWCCSKKSFTTNGNNNADCEMSCGYFKWA